MFVRIFVCLDVYGSVEKYRLQSKQPMSVLMLIKFKFWCVLYGVFLINFSSFKNNIGQRIGKQ